jgi:endonuclease/exonuclease/phosphatase family metal-dependent hydrolase
VRNGLGPDFGMVCRGDNAQLAVVYDERKVSVREEALLPLPKLKSLSRFAALYMLDKDPEQKYALVCTVTPHGGDPFTLVNFHLDAAGGNKHRQEQLAAVTTALVARDLHRRLVAVGDTNVFTLRASKHRRAYEELLSPLAELGAVDPESRPTHFFARARDRKLPQRVMRAIGHLRVDLPRRYDVICSNLPTLARGQVATPDSDHDLLWARVETSAIEDSQPARHDGDGANAWR